MDTAVERQRSLDFESGQDVNWDWKWEWNWKPPCLWFDQEADVQHSRCSGPLEYQLGNVNVSVEKKEKLYGTED